MTEALSRHEADVHRHGDGTRIAGINADFVCYPVQAWWDQGEAVTVFMSLGQGSRAIEVLRLDKHAFRDLHVRDRSLGQEAPAEPTFSRKEEGNPSFDPFFQAPTETPRAASSERSQATPSLQESWTEIGFGDDVDP